MECEVSHSMVFLVVFVVLVLLWFFSLSVCVVYTIADLALVQMADQYQLSRARRSKHEALQEEREAKKGIN
jgi:hypothetical protein